LHGDFPEIVFWHFVYQPEQFSDPPMKYIHRATYRAIERVITRILVHFRRIGVGGIAPQKTL
jgi:hypothetical protein